MTTLSQRYWQIFLELCSRLFFAGEQPTRNCRTGTRGTQAHLIRKPKHPAVERRTGIVCYALTSAFLTGLTILQTMLGGRTRAMDIYT